MTSDRRHLPIAALFNLFVVYIVWGSTYLAIRVAVREGAGWGPFWLGASRVLAAAAILFLINALRGQRLKPTQTELGILIASGLFLWLGGNGAVLWAEQRIDSGLAALVVGSMPIWVATIEGLIDRRPPSSRLVGSLVVGFAGVAVLTLPTLEGGIGGDFLGVAAVVFASISWGIGSILMNRRPVRLDSIVVSGWQQLIGGIGFAAAALVFREAAPRPIPEAWAAWAYLLIFGSLFAFTSFIFAVKRLPTTVVMTYAYVNPVIAVFLGWFILSEPVTGYTFAGMVLIVLGVIGVFHEKTRVVSSR